MKKAMLERVMSRRVAVRAAATALAAGGLLIGTGAAANASSNVYTSGQYTVYEDSQAHWITASYDGMNVAIADGGTYLGAGAIQWYNDGAAEQKWYFDQVYDQTGGYEGVLLRNENSGLCLVTDGNAGDQVYQWPCNPNTSGELFWHYGSVGAYNSFEGRSTGLYLDVSGYSYGAGANIDLWYSNGQPNQLFWVSNVSS